MALISIAPGFDGESEGTTARYVMKGVSDTIDDTPDDILASFLCPQRGDTDSRNTSRVLTNVTVEHASKETKSLYWLISVTAELPQIPTPDPLQSAPAISLASEQYERLTCIDGEGNAILNAAGSLMFVPVESTRYSFNCRVNVATVPVWVLNGANRINSGDINVSGLLCKKGTLMLKNINVSESQTVQSGTQQVSFVSLSFAMFYKEEGWDVEYPNVGFEAYFDNEPVYERILGPSGRRTNKIKVDPKTKRAVWTLGRVRRRITDVMGVAVTEPQMLDEQGRVVEEPTAEKLITRKAKPYKTLDFSQLPL